MVQIHVAHQTVIVDKLVKSPDCESGIYGFDPHLSPISAYSITEKCEGLRTLVCVGLNPTMRSKCLAVGMVDKAVLETVA